MIPGSKNEKARTVRTEGGKASIRCAIKVLTVGLICPEPPEKHTKGLPKLSPWRKGGRDIYHHLQTPINWRLPLEMLTPHFWAPFGQADFPAAESEKIRNTLKTILLVWASMELSTAVTMEISSGLKQCDIGHQTGSSTTARRLSSSRKKSPKVFLRTEKQNSLDHWI